MITRVPFRLSGGNQPLILFSVHLETQGPFEAILDTGAGTTLLAPPLANALALERTGTRAGRGAGGAVTVEMAKLGTLAAGQWSVGPLSIAITQEVETIARTIGSRAQVNVGADALRAHRLTVDYVASTLTFATVDEPWASDRVVRADLEFRLAAPAKPLILVPVELDGQGPLTFAIDTGASTTVISGELASRLKLRTEAMPSMTGGGGAVAASAAVASKLKVGETTLSQVRLAVAESITPLGQLLGTPFDGILGYNVLRRFRVTIDYPASRLRLD